MASAPYLHDVKQVGHAIERSHHGGWCLVAAVLFLIALRIPSPKMLLLVVALSSLSMQASPLDLPKEERRNHVEKIRAELATLPLKSPKRAVLLANWASLIADESPDDALLLTREAFRLEPSSAAIRHNLEVLERRFQPQPMQEETTEKQTVADFDELLSLPAERTLEQKETPQDNAPSVSVPSTPGTWREIRRRNRLIKPRMMKTKPW